MHWHSVGSLRIAEKKSLWRQVYRAKLANSTLAQGIGTPPYTRERIHHVFTSKGEKHCGYTAIVLDRILATDEMFFFNCIGDTQCARRPKRKKIFGVESIKRSVQKETIALEAVNVLPPIETGDCLTQREQHLSSEELQRLPFH